MKLNKPFHRTFLYGLDGNDQFFGYFQQESAVVMGYGPYYTHGAPGSELWVSEYIIGEKGVKILSNDLFYREFFSMFQHERAEGSEKSIDLGLVVYFIKYLYFGELISVKEVLRDVGWKFILEQHGNEVFTYNCAAAPVR